MCWFRECLKSPAFINSWWVAKIYRFNVYFSSKLTFADRLRRDLSVFSAEKVKNERFFVANDRGFI